MLGYKQRIIVFLPVMIELEMMGYNPVEIMFGEGKPTMNEVEACYIAQVRAKEKHPGWYEVVSSHVSKMMRGKL